MRPKPTPPKRKKTPPKDVHKGWEIENIGGRYHVFNVEDGRELWDSGYSTREEAVAEIDEIAE